MTEQIESRQIESRQVENRLAELKREYQAGEEQLRQLVLRETALRETLLRISGAIQVLEELREPDRQNGRPATEPVPPDPSNAQMLTVG